MLAQENALHPRDPRTGLLPNAGPISLAGKGNEKAVLLIHGFGDTPFDLKPLAIALYKEGFTVYAPLLPATAQVSGTSSAQAKKTGYRRRMRPSTCFRASTIKSMSSGFRWAGRGAGPRRE